MSLSCVATALTTTSTKRVGCCCFAHVRSSTKGVGSWDQHRVVWTCTAYPEGYTYTTTDPRPGAQQGVTVNLRDGEFEGYTLGFYATHEGSYTWQATITDAAGNTSSDTVSFTIAATTKTVTLAADGSGDYTTFAALSSGEGLGGSSDLGLDVIVKEGTYSQAGSFTITADSVRLRWDGVGAKPIFRSDDATVFSTASENITLDGFVFETTETTGLGSHLVEMDGQGQVGLIDSVIDEWIGHGVGGYFPAWHGILLKDCVFGAVASTSTEPNPRWALLSNDQVWIGCAPNDNIHTNRCFYDLGSVGITAIACHMKSETSILQAIRMRNTSWAYWHRCRITNEIVAGNQDTDTGGGKIRVHACYLGRSNNSIANCARFGATGSSEISEFGYYACIMELTPQVDRAVFNAAVPTTGSVSDLHLHGCTLVTSTENGNGANIFELGSRSTVSAGCSVAACLGVDGGGTLAIGISYFEFDSAFDKTVAGVVVPVTSTRTPNSWNGNHFFVGHPDGDTNVVATFNTYTGISDVVEEDVTLDGNYLPDTSTTFSVPEGVHTDYYGNSVSGTMLPGAAQALPPALGKINFGGRGAASSFIIMVS